MVTATHFPDPVHEIYERARQSRDPRFDGRFFVGVKTTGIYCRPVCPVKLPRAENVTFFSSAAAAMDQGFRPCLRCRPEASPGTPAWAGTSATVSRAVRLIAEGALDEGDVNDLAARLGVGSRHLSRLFHTHLGTSPRSVAQARRLHFAKRLIDETDLKMAQIAFSAGYKSVRRFNDHVRSVYKRSPVQLRGRRQPAANTPVQFNFHYRPPFDWQHMLGFLAQRASPGVELVRNGAYLRNFRTRQGNGFFRVAPDEETHSLHCAIQVVDYSELLVIVERIKQMFDLAADPAQIGEGLLRDEPAGGLMHRLLTNLPVTRIPAGWDGFEIAVRAIVGQQVSVAGATTVMGRIVKTYGEQLTDTARMDGLDYLFPLPQDLASLDPSALSMPRARARAIRDMSSAVCRGEIDFSGSAERLVSQLKAIKGIGDWTAQYVAMRSCGDPDAFLSGDLVLRKAVEKLSGQPVTVRGLEQLAESWRPWRAYAGMLLWRSLA